jgi:hypothetical protein
VRKRAFRSLARISSFSLRGFVMRLALAALLFCSACHGHDHDGYSTYQACYDEHKNVEKLTVQQAIVVCCLDHPVNGVSEVCGATSADCATYLGANLTGPTQAEVMAACTEYITQKGM